MCQVILYKKKEFSFYGVFIHINAAISTALLTPHSLGQGELEDAFSPASFFIFIESL